MKPGRLNLVCPQGATFAENLIYRIDDVPVDLTGYTARMQVRRTHSSKTFAIELTTENSRIDLTDDGYISLSISATDTAAIKPGKYVYDLELVSSGNIVYRLVEGEFLVTAEVTR